MHSCSSVGSLSQLTMIIQKKNSSSLIWLTFRLVSVSEFSLQFHNFHYIQYLTCHYQRHQEQSLRCFLTINLLFKRDPHVCLLVFYYYYFGVTHLCSGLTTGFVQRYLSWWCSKNISNVEDHFSDPNGLWIRKKSVKMVHIEKSTLWKGKHILLPPNTSLKIFNRICIMSKFN